MRPGSIQYWSTIRPFQGSSHYILTTSVAKCCKITKFYPHKNLTMQVIFFLPQYYSTIISTIPLVLFGTFQKLINSEVLRQNKRSYLVWAPEVGLDKKKVNSQFVFVICHLMNNYLKLRTFTTSPLNRISIASIVLNCELVYITRYLFTIILVAFMISIKLGTLCFNVNICS